MSSASPLRRAAFARSSTLVLLVAACGTEAGREEPSPGTLERDASTATGAPLGGACTSSRACADGDALCLTELSVLDATVHFSGGYCSADCGTSDDCGAEGGCPVGDVKSEQAGSPAATLFEDLPARCLQRCASDEECRTREGYRCKPMLSALPSSLRPFAEGLLSGQSIAEETFCVPPSEEGGAASGT